MLAAGMWRVLMQCVGDVLKIGTDITLKMT